jgi:hypothetical protein
MRFKSALPGFETNLLIEDQSYVGGRFLRKIYCAEIRSKPLSSLIKRFAAKLGCHTSHK